MKINEMLNLHFTMAQAEFQPEQRHSTGAKVAWRQYTTMLRKDLIVTLKHPVILVIELLLPALLFITICDDRFKTPATTKYYEPVDLQKFDLSSKSIAYFPSDYQPLIDWMTYMGELYDRQPESNEFVAFKNESEFKNFVLYQCSDCFAAAFTFNETDPHKVEYTYGWMVNSQFIGDQETGKGSEMLFDPIIAENMAEYATVRYLSENQDVKIIQNNVINNVSANIYVRKFPDIPYYDTFTIHNKIGSGAPVVLGLGCLTSLPAFTLQIVSDKQARLRQSLHTVGLMDSMFWLSLTTVAIILAFAQAALVVIFADISGYVYMRNSPPFLNLIILFLTFFASHTFSFIIGALIGNIKIFVMAIFVCFILYFIIGTLCTNHQSIYPIAGGPSGWQAIFLTHTAQAMYLISLRAIPYIDKYYPSQVTKFKWSEVWTFQGTCSDYTCDPSGYATGHTVSFSLTLLIILAILHIFLAWYIDLLMPQAHGSSLKFYEPFTLEYWGCTKNAPPPPSQMPGYKCDPAGPAGDGKGIGIANADDIGFEDADAEWDDDVRTEAKRILAPPGSVEYSMVRDSAIIIYELCVTFKRFFQSKKQAKKAVRQLCLQVPKNTVLGLLGTNGAGKTTTLSVITGQIRPTSGYVTVNGFSCQHQRHQVARCLGYAPQFDVLWSELTPAEHIRLFSNLRGLDYATEIEQIQASRIAALNAGLAPMTEEVDDLAPQAQNDDTIDHNSDEEHGLLTGHVVPHHGTKKQLRKLKKQQLKQLIQMRLTDVGLKDKANYKSGSLSGGMKRRLTLCLALVGNSPMLLLDEISTGLDPVSRRKVWDCVLRAKTDRSVILTTHSMEEAETLSDRIAIMSLGKLRCVGTSARLKRRYGMGYRVDIQCNFDPIKGISDVLKIKEQLVEPYMPEAKLVGRTGGHLTLAISRKVNSEQIQRFLEKLEDRTDIVQKWGIRQTTLEEVFLSISRYIERRSEIQRILSTK